jgi:hypothetical protein
MKKEKEIEKIKSLVGNDEMAVGILDKAYNEIRLRKKYIILILGVILILSVFILILTVSELKANGNSIFNCILYSLLFLVTDCTFMVFSLSFYRASLIDREELNYLNSLLQDVTIQDNVYSAKVRDGRCYFYENGKLNSIKYDKDSDAVKVQSLARYSASYWCSLDIEKEYRVLELD